jgi:hypothetical protein
MSKAQDLTRFGETARQLRAVVPPHERIRDPDRLDGLFMRLLRRILWSCPAMIVGAIGVFGWQYGTDRVLVPRGDVVLLELTRQTLEPMNPPGKEITETEINGLAETIRQLGLILQPAAPRPWLKDLARLVEFNGDSNVLEHRGRMLQHFLTVMEKVPVKDRAQVMTSIILHAQSRIDWMPYAEMLTKFSVDLIDLTRTGKIPELEQAMRVALAKARAEADLRKAAAALEKETLDLEGKRKLAEENRRIIRQHIDTTTNSDRRIRICADKYVECQRQIERPK